MKRVVFKVFNSRTMTLDNYASRESVLENIRLEYQNRMMDVIVNDQESSNDKIRHRRPTRVVY